MENNTQEKNLIKKNESTIFYKIKRFFCDLFGIKNKNIETSNEKINTNEYGKKEEFKEYIKKTEDEETQILDLQRRYRRGEIGDNDLTDEQIKSLCDLYDKQILELKKSIENKTRQIEEYKKSKKVNNI